MELRNCDDSINIRKGEIANEMFGDTYIDIADDHKLTVLHQIMWELVNAQKVRKHIDGVLSDETCEWNRKFDGHFSIGCANQTGERANGNFKPDFKLKDTKWNFKYCPYCGKEIKIIES